MAFVVGNRFMIGLSSCAMRGVRGVAAPSCVSVGSVMNQICLLNFFLMFFESSFTNWENGSQNVAKWVSASIGVWGSHGTTRSTSARSHRALGLKHGLLKATRLFRSEKHFHYLQRRNPVLWPGVFLWLFFFWGTQDQQWLWKLLMLGFSSVLILQLIAVDIAPWQIPDRWAADIWMLTLRRVPCSPVCCWLSATWSLKGERWDMTDTHEPPFSSPFNVFLVLPIIFHSHDTATWIHSHPAETIHFRQLILHNTLFLRVILFVPKSYFLQAEVVSSLNSQQGWVMLKDGMCEMPKYALIYAVPWLEGCMPLGWKSQTWGPAKSIIYYTFPTHAHAHFGGAQVQSGSLRFFAGWTFSLKSCRSLASWMVESQGSELMHLWVVSFFLIFLDYSSCNTVSITLWFAVGCSRKPCLLAADQLTAVAPFAGELNLHHLRRLSRSQTGSCKTCGLQLEFFLEIGKLSAFALASAWTVT